jgi:2-oxoglutarate ferredoxin oxidoreductase subunit alpha
MIDDVRMALGPDREVGFFGRTGGVVPTPDDVLAAIGEVTGKGAAR